MLLLKAGLLLFLCTSVYSANESFECPDASTELLVGKDLNECNCYKPIAVLYCKHLTVKFNLTKIYNFKSIVIEESPKMPFLLERVNEFVKSNGLTTESLVILNEKADLKFPFTGNLDDLLEASTKSIKIVGNSKQTLDIAKVKPSVESIVIENIKLITENYENVPDIKFFSRDNHIQHLVIKNSNFEDVREVTLLKGPMERVEFSKTNINGIFVYEPEKECQPNAETTIHIDLHNNNNLTGIDFHTLFNSTKSKDCLFHISLSHSEQLKQFLEDYDLADILEKNIGRFYLQLRNQEIECGCGILDLYTYIKDENSATEMKMSDYIHSVYCQSGDGKQKFFLDDVVKNNDLKQLICPN